MIDLFTIQKNIEIIQKNIDYAALRAGRKSSDVMLMAVTKTKPAEVVKCLLDAGIVCFGENYPDETVGKIDVFRAEPAAWLAMIGHLQSRKAKIVADLFDDLAGNLFHVHPCAGGNFPTDNHEPARNICFARHAGRFIFFQNGI